jgi:hypothetical protein
VRLHGFIQRLQHSYTNQLTSEVIRVGAFYTKLQNRLPRPLLNADKRPAKIEIRRASPRSNTRSTNISKTHASAPPHKVVTTLQVPTTKSN